MTTCRTCNQSFEINTEDKAFYKKLDLSKPEICPNCRHQNRLAFRNERVLYKRKCDKCNRQIIALYPEGSEYKIYCNSCWWSDNWSPMEYGIEYDLDRDFFDQFTELQKKVPRLALHQKATENSEYTNHSEEIRSCYLTIDCAYSENIYYCNLIGSCKDMIDCYQIEKSELCYESLYSNGAYNCNYVFISDNCKESSFLYDCNECSNCFMCWNLRHKQYCIDNNQYSKKEYEEIMKKVDLGSRKQLKKFRKVFLDSIREKAIVKHQNLINCQNCSGDMLHNCKNVHNSFGMKEAEDCKHSIINWYIKDSYDAFESAFDCELQYNTHGCNRGKRAVSAHVSYDIDSVAYVDSCYNSSDLFGCIGLRHKKYCILNKQYPKEKYETLKKKIIDYLRENGGYGQFFPIFISPYPYNNTIAQEDFPLIKESALEKGYKWRDDEAKDTNLSNFDLPDNIKDVNDDITKQVFTCTKCGKNYKIIAQELDFYQKKLLPVPSECHDCRYLDRISLRPPRKLFNRNCSKCGIDIKSPHRKEYAKNVYCEKCYLKEIY